MEATVQLHYPFHLLLDVPQRGVPLNYSTQFSEEDNVTSTEQLKHVARCLSVRDSLAKYTERMGRFVVDTLEEERVSAEFSFSEHVLRGLSTGNAVLNQRKGSYALSEAESEEIRKYAGGRMSILQNFGRLDSYGKRYYPGSEVVIGAGVSEGVNIYWIAEVRQIVGIEKQSGLEAAVFLHWYCRSGTDAITSFPLYKRGYVECKPFSPPDIVGPANMVYVGKGKSLLNIDFLSGYKINCSFS